ESYFRRLESKVLEEVAGEKRFVVSCGGGIVANEENIRIMKETGLIICLKATPGVILKRTQGSSSRPLLNVKNPKEKISLLLKLRAPYYAKAHKSINTSSLSVQEVTKRIMKLIK
ncbi:MAG: shikimate kinase, partial [Candidatus Omnitrophica bacterium]|nr:shikimate kinase [Candidatus Omnitrophota bacterium]